MPLFTRVSESEVFAKHLTQHLTQQVTFSPRAHTFIRFLEVVCSEKEQMQNKMREVLGEVLSDLFAKHLPREKPCKQRRFGRKSEVGRCFFDFPFFICIRVATSI